MHLPDLPAASATPFAVLLLAWDEAAPAVRAVLEAAQAPTPTQPKVTVIVPAGPPTPEPSDTFTTAAQPATAVPEAAPSAAAPPASAAAPAPTSAVANPSAALAAPGLALLSPPLPDSSKASNVPSPPAQAGPAVRVLRLSSLSLAALAAHASQPLPAPVWTGPVAAPAAPYLGAATALVECLADAPPVSVSVVSTAATAASPRSEVPLPIRDAGPAPLAAATGERTEEKAEPTPLVTGYLPVPTFFLSPTEEPNAPLDSDFPDTSSVALTTNLATAPESAAWIAALEALQSPAEAEVPAPNAALTREEALPASDEATDAPTPPNHAVLGLPAPLPDAPDLNFQIIQYARFAVPVALAEQPFGVLYAPGWPTWLAAQELRQRTGRPLVLHLSALAAGAESAETATGWMAELQRQALRRADLVLTETHALASRLRRELGLPAHAVRVVAATDTAAIARALHRVHG